MEFKCIQNKIGGLNVENFKSREFLDNIKAYGKFLSSCYGQCSHLYLAKSSTGNTTLGNSSLNINETFSFSHPAIKFINAFIEAQNQSYGFGGSYIGMICCGLLHKAFDLSQIPQHQIQLVADQVMSVVTNHLNDTKQRTKFNIGNLKHVSNYVKTMLFSKSHYDCLHKCDDVVMAIVKSFIDSTPTTETATNNFGNIYVLAFEDYCLTKVIPGLCLYCPEIDRMDKIAALKDITKILVFNTPIAYDVPESDLLVHKTYMKSALHNEYSTLLKSILLKWKVEAIFCQKYINEEIKFDLERSGIMVFERLGLDPTCSLVALANCLPVCSLIDLENSINECYVGSVSLLVEEINQRYVLVVRNPVHNCDVTLIISETVTIGGNIKKKVDSCLKILRLTAINPDVVPGAGCFEASCILAMYNDESLRNGSTANRLNVPQIFVEKVVRMFVEVFSDLAIAPTNKNVDAKLNYALDLHSGHLWKTEDDDYFQSKSTDMMKSCACKQQHNRKTCFLPLDQLMNDIHLKKCQCSDIIYDPIQSAECFDYYPAKCNAIILGFNAFLELFKVVLCIYDNS